MKQLIFLSLMCISFVNICTASEAAKKEEIIVVKNKKIECTNPYCMCEPCTCVDCRCPLKDTNQTTGKVASVTKSVDVITNK